MPYYHYEQGHKNYLKSICGKLLEIMYIPVADLKATAWVTPEPIPYEKRRLGKRKDLKPGQKWGQLWDCAWFNFTGRIPQDAKGKNVVALIDVRGEACVFDKSGTPVRGLAYYQSHGDIDAFEVHGKKVFHLEKAKPGEKVDFWVDAGANELWGKAQDLGYLKQAQLAICNEQLRAFFYDFSTLLELMQGISTDKARHHRILKALTDAAHSMIHYTEAEAKTARKILAPELSKKGCSEALTISAAGHAHIDLAWLWPIRESIRKGARTFSTVDYLMDRYKDYIFGASQAQLYQWIKDYYPGLYKKVKQRIKQGRWDIQGTLWVEMDTNVAGAEALVRQILYGKRFFRKEFGVDVKNCWLPDAFGFSGVMPQLFKKSGVDYFVTTKLSWNKFNEYPHHSFNWQGIDGSTVLVHMPPFSHYNATATPRDIHTHEKNYRDKMVSQNMMMLFGIGDGGGGPGAEHLEALQREKNLESLPPVTQRKADEFFKLLERERDDFYTWTGEMYLEMHQGCLTSQARNKRYNRKLELALRELELTAILARTVAHADYPQQQLDEIWKEMLLYQFHDILPGSSITRVYDESLARYAILMDQVEQLTVQAQQKLLQGIDTAQAQQPAVVFNSLSWPRNEWIKVANRWKKVQAPAMGYAVVDLTEKQPKPTELHAEKDKLENDILRVRFDKNGWVKSVYDKQNHREVLDRKLPGNQLNVYEDILAHTSDEAWGADSAWDFPVHYEEKLDGVFELESATAHLDGPRAILKQTRKYGNSKMVQEIILIAGSRRLDFVTQVDWNESCRMLRTGFALAVANEYATCDIQFGSIRRPTHRNTPWDMAKFEICAQKWIDLSQADYGVALMNDCKYGHKAKANLLDINLLRSPGFPDPKADRARHEFTYSFYPHGGNHVEGGVISAGYELNVPLRVTPVKKPAKPKLPNSMSFMTVDADNIVIETVKKAEDSNEMIVRLYESYGGSCQTHLNFAGKVKSAKLVNLLEEQPTELKVSKNKLTLNFSPFEIQTIKVSL
ncbi:MAG: alpha-mannosidase [Sedimentisphaerales bacterium]|nr:alpha-mannosidase [Sedimentisphaerales bacterium]